MALIGAISALVIERYFSKIMTRIPEKYTPVLGSINPEVINYAEKLNRTIPTPDETLEIVRKNDVLAN